MQVHTPLCTGPCAVHGMSRRELLHRFGMGIGGIALAQLLAQDARAELAPTQFPAKAKRIIYLFQSGGPSQLDLYDHKPLLNKMNGQQLPDSVRQGQRLTGMSANQASLPLAGSIFNFKQHGESGATVSDLLPYTAAIADDLCFVKSMYTEAINHDPAITFFQTGSQIAGRPSLGAWLSYGLGSENQDLPAYVALLTKGAGGQPLYSRLWGAGFLPSEHQGVQFRSGADPVLYLTNPDGVAPEARRKLLDRLDELHALQRDATQDPEYDARIAQYEMAFRMQASVPHITDMSDEPEETFQLYGPDSRTPGTYAANCLLARRLIERGTRIVQLFHRDWDHHGGLPGGIRAQAKLTDQPSAALVTDLKRRGLLDDTLVIWGGEFGRTNYSQGQLTPTDYGRDHHPRCFTLWMAGGGTNAGHTHGATDDFGYNIAQDGVHVHDLHATLLHLLGLNHTQLTYPFQGRKYRLTDVFGNVVPGLIA